jgi:hypothetical protein
VPSDINLQKCEKRDPYKNASGNVYTGEWLKETQIREGIGVLVHANGDVYEGYWRDDKKHGYGRYIWTDGDYYEGQWENGELHGHGV